MHQSQEVLMRMKHHDVDVVHHGALDRHTDVKAHTDMIAANHVTAEQRAALNSANHAGQNTDFVNHSKVGAGLEGVGARVDDSTDAALMRRLHASGVDVIHHGKTGAGLEGVGARVDDSMNAANVARCAGSGADVIHHGALDGHAGAKAHADMVAADHMTPEQAAALKAANARVGM